MKSRDEIRLFLSEPVPATGTPQWKAWKDTAGNLGKSAPAVALYVLRLGTEEEQYAAVLALRELGFEAFGQGHGQSLTYTVRKLGKSEWKVIKPLCPPCDAPPGGRATGTK